MRRTKNPKVAKATAPTAAQRIQQLEATMGQLIKIVQLFEEELGKLGAANQGLNQKVDAIINVSEKLNEGEKVNTKVVEQYLINQKVLELTNRVETLVNSGILTASEEITGDDNFVVGKELSKEGDLVSPRTQATIASLPAETKAAFIGKKIGDLVEFSEDKLSFLIDEIYLVKQEEKAVDFEAQEQV